MDQITDIEYLKIQRKYLIPLAESFIRRAEDSSSLPEFKDFIINNNSTPCNKNNVKTWRRDAFNALQYVHNRLAVEDEIEPETPNNLKQTPNEMFNSPSEPLTSAQNWQKSALRKSDISCSIPANRIEDIVGTVPDSFLNQVGLAFKCNLYPKDDLDIPPTVLINGPPFCGKTKLIKSIAGTLQVNYISVTVGVVNPSARSWREIFCEARKCAPCILHIDAIECMEKHNVPIGGFSVVCLLKNELLPECLGTGVTVVGETRRLFASLPQDVTDLFTDRFTFGMMEESCRLNLLSKYLLESNSDASSDTKIPLFLGYGLTIRDIAHRTPGYESGDLIRLVRALHMELISKSEECDGSAVGNQVSWKMLDAALNQVIPAVKNTAEFVTIPDVTWKDVGGLEKTKAHLHNQFMLLINDWERAQKLRRRSGGVLLEGPPGCGKTLIAKALSNTAGLNFLSVKGPEILNKYQGESERRIREIFERARACQPCLIFFDEIDAICPRRDGNESNGSRVSVVNQMLVELDGIDKHRQARVFVVGATNRKDMIDEAILRPGRLGLHLYVSPPESQQDRVDILSACTRGATAPYIKGGTDVLNRVAADPRTKNMSGADLENLLETAKLNAHLKKRDFLLEADFQFALQELKK
nr:nuclear valosin containing protein [Hymenolepis microstoma]